jgi:hypothetical protein
LREFWIAVKMKNGLEVTAVKLFLELHQSIAVLGGSVLKFLLF